MMTSQASFITPGNGCDIRGLVPQLLLFGCGLQGSAAHTP